MAATPTRAELEEFLQLQADRQKHDRESRQLKSRENALAAGFRAYLEQLGKASVKRHGHRLQLVDGAVRVSWRDAFILECGPDRAAALQDAAPPTKKLVVTAEP